MSTAGTLRPGDSAAPRLEPNAIGFREALAVGLASTAPAYSLAAVIGTVTVIVGFQAPGAMLASFVPMFLIAGAFFYMNRADQDAGTTFSWVTRTMGPWLGWLGGWAVCTTGILVVGSLADVGARYTYELVGWESAAASKSAVMALAVAYIVVMTAICIIGTELTGAIQDVLIVLQVGALLLFAGAALYKVYDGTAPAASTKPELDWFSPFAISSTSTLVSALLIGVFIYWGWESAVNLTEETRDSARAPGLAAVLSTVILLVTYVGVAVAVVAYAGLETLAEYDDDDAIFAVLGADVLGSPWDKLVILAIVTSAIASTQTTIIPSSRTSFSMGRQSALPRKFAAVHPRFRTPWFSTVVIAGLAIAWYVPLNILSQNALYDTLSALSLMIAFYYALSGIRLRDLLPAGAYEVDQEPSPHRSRPARGRSDPRLPVRQVGDRLLRCREFLFRADDSRHGRPARDRGWLHAPRARAARAVASRWARALLRTPRVRGGRPRRRPR